MFETTGGRLVNVMVAAAHSVVGVLRSRHGADLGPHCKVETVAVSRSKWPHDGPLEASDDPAVTDDDGAESDGSGAHVPSRHQP